MFLQLSGIIRNDLASTLVPPIRRQIMARARTLDILPFLEAWNEKKTLAVTLVANDAAALLQFRERVLDVIKHRIVVRHALATEETRIVEIHAVVLNVAP